MTKEELERRMLAVVKDRFDCWNMGVAPYNGDSQPGVAAVTVFFPRNHELFGVGSIRAAIAMELAEANKHPVAERLTESVVRDRLAEALRARCVAARLAIMERIGWMYVNVQQATLHCPVPLTPDEFERRHGDK